jgi:hypothetical protein
VRPCSVDYYTSTRDDTDVDVVAQHEVSPGGLFNRGEVQVFLCLFISSTKLWRL